MKMVHKIYLSGPLFSAGEIAWGERFSALLREHLTDMEVIWPHEIVPDRVVPEGIFRANLKALDGIRTDFRRAGESDGSRVNLMIERSCVTVASSTEELYSELERLLD
jgi:hypothetical protein